MKRPSRRNQVTLSPERMRQIEREEYAKAGRVPEWRKREIEAEEVERFIRKKRRKNLRIPATLELTKKGALVLVNPKYLR